jgi:hypothetical protein
VKRRSDKDITALFREGTAVDRAVANAAMDAVRLHRRHNVPLVSWEGGQVVHIDPWTVTLPEDSGESDDRRVAL